MGTKFERERNISTMDIVQQANDGSRADFNVVIYDNALAEVANVSCVFEFGSETLYAIPCGARVKHVDFVIDSPDVFSDIREAAYFVRDEMREGVPFATAKDKAS